MKKERKDSILKIDVQCILNLLKCPKCVSVNDDRNKAIEYAVFKYVNCGDTITSIA